MRIIVYVHSEDISASSLNVSRGENFLCFHFSQIFVVDAHETQPEAITTDRRTPARRYLPAATTVHWRI